MTTGVGGCWFVPHWTTTDSVDIYQAVEDAGKGNTVKPVLIYD